MATMTRARRRTAGKPAAKRMKAAGTMPVSVRISPDLQSKLEAGADKLGLAPAQVMRLSLERGLDVLIKQLTGKDAGEDGAALAEGE